MLYRKHIKLNRKTFCFIFSLGFFLFILSAPSCFKEHVRFFFIDKILSLRFFNKKISCNSISLDTLKSENYFLKQENNHLRSLLSIYDFFSLELENTKRQDLSYCNRCIPAKVIFRDPFSWGSSLWIDVGKQNLSSSVLKKNSPVIIGQFLLGIVDYVGQRQSRVKLITDVGLTPSVCVATENLQDIILRNSLKIVLEQLKRNSQARLFSQEISQMTSFLSNLEKTFFYKNKKYNLFRGILCGTGSPLWKKHKNLLKGQGFCYQENIQDEDVYIIKENDILVTTGMDGIFPPGLLVAKVTNVLEKKEGFYSYNLEAMPLVDNFNDISNVLVLPPIGFNEEDFPSIFRFLNVEED